MSLNFSKKEKQLKINIKIFSKEKFLSKEFLFPVISGLLLGFSFPPFPFFILAFFSLVPLFFVIEKKNTLSGVNKTVYLFAFFFNLITLYWVGSWTKEADPFLKISGIVLLFFNPLLFLIPATLFYLAKKYVNPKIAFYLLPFFWVFYEYIYSVTEFRFPWLTLGNSQAHFTSFIQISEFIGVYGISIIIIYVNLFLFFAIKQYSRHKDLVKSLKFSGIALALFVFPLIYGLSVNAENFKGESIRVGIIQPNFNPWKKWDAENLDEQIDVYFNLSEKAIKEGAELLVFPETALPVYLTSFSYSRELNRFYKFCDTNKVPILTGMPDLNIYNSYAPKDAKQFRNSKRKYTIYNSVYLFNPGKREIQKYHKTLLVPFGEKVPYVEYLPFLGKLLQWEVGISSWNVGEGAKTLTTEIKNRKIKLGAAVCIESIYPEYISKFVNKGAEALFIVTNDSWYGKSSGPYQHESIAILRAVENRRYVVRAANGGISCIISPNGKILSQTDLFVRTELTGNVKLLKNKTFYTLHPYIVPFFAVFITSIVLVFILFLRLKLYFIRN